MFPENVDALAELCRHTRIPIATGERVFTKYGFRELLEKKAAHIIQPDPAHCGGILETKKIAAMAEAYYTQVAPHCPYFQIALATAARALWQKPRKRRRCYDLGASATDFVRQSRHKYRVDETRNQQ